MLCVLHASGIYHNVGVNIVLQFNRNYTESLWVQMSPFPGFCTGKSNLYIKQHKIFYPKKYYMTNIHNNNRTTQFINIVYS